MAKKSFLLDKAVWLLEHGYILQVKGKTSTGRIYMAPEDAGSWYRYNYYGSSAVEATRDKLQWVFETIFESYDYVAFGDWDTYYVNQAADARGMWLYTDGAYPYPEAERVYENCERRNEDAYSV